MKLRCQQTILGNQCKHSVYKNEMYCRWHKILREFRRDNQRLPEHTHIFASGYMYTAGISIFGFLFCLSLFDTTNNVLWVLAAFLSLAWSFVYASDGIMARGEDYPLSLFAFWPKLLTAGMSLGVLMSVLLLIDVMVIP